MVDQKKGGFRYKPVSSAAQQIRLIQFKNVPFEHANFEQSPLECSMVTASLGENPEYRTLSYVWGEDTRCKPLLVDGKLMYITVSLDIALRHLMLFQDLLKQHIWIDAVCINQEDNEEKAWQVRMMKDIYMNAKSSIGWLGLADEVSRLALETAWECNLYMEFVKKFGNWEMWNNALPRIGEDIIFAPPSGNLRRNNAIRLFLDRQFFARTWIHQEVMVARHIDLVCGTDVCDWDGLHLAIMSMSKYLGDATFGTPLDGLGLKQLTATTGPILGSPTPKCFQLRFYFEENTLAYNLWSLVVLTRASKAPCSNGRDAIYGVLSVANDAKKLKISPDYDASIEQCYIQTAKAFLRNGHLDVLTACQQPRSAMKLPSWVPDFSTLWDDEYNVVTAIEHMSRTAEDTFYGPLFRAAKGSSPKIFCFEKRGEHQLLCLAGIKFDQIDRIAPPLDLDYFNKLHVSKNPDVVRGSMLGDPSAVEQLQKVHTRNPDAVQAAMLAQIKNVQDLSRLEQSRSSNSMETVLRVLTKDMEFGTQPGKGTVLHRLPPKTLESYVPFVTMLQQFRPLSAWPFVTLQKEFLIFYHMILCRNIERRAFITLEGHLGIGPAALQEDDVVAIILGTEVPLLLRPCEGGVYKLIGEAYVDGIMDGEVMKKKPSISTFEIC